MIKATLKGKQTLKGSLTMPTYEPQVVFVPIAGPQGPIGPRGARGEKGEKGDKGQSSLDLIIFRGEWDVGAQYKYGDIVYRNGSSYACVDREGCKGIDPALYFLRNDESKNSLAPTLKAMTKRLGKNIDSTTNFSWMIIASKGLDNK